MLIIICRVLLNLLDRVAGESYTKFLEYLMVYFAEHYSRVYLTSFKLRQLVESLSAVSSLMLSNESATSTSSV